jgi:hypothetical protein
MSSNQNSKMRAYWQAQYQVNKIAAKMNAEGNAARHLALEVLLAEEERKLAALA